MSGNPRGDAGGGQGCRSFQGCSCLPKGQTWCWSEHRTTVSPQTARRPGRSWRWQVGGAGCQRPAHLICWVCCSGGSELLGFGCEVSGNHRHAGRTDVGRRPIELSQQLSPVHLVTSAGIQANWALGPYSPSVDGHLQTSTGHTCPSPGHVTGVYLPGPGHLDTWFCELGSRASASGAWMQGILQGDGRPPSASWLTRGRRSSSLNCFAANPCHV